MEAGTGRERESSDSKNGPKPLFGPYILLPYYYIGFQIFNKTDVVLVTHEMDAKSSKKKMQKLIIKGAKRIIQKAKERILKE